MVVEGVGWGIPALAVMGGILGDLECFIALGAAGPSLTPLVPGQEPEGMQLAARCWGQSVWPGSVLPCHLTGIGSQ